MSNKTMSDKELDALMVETRIPIEDDGFSSSVVRRLKRKRLMSGIYPVFCGFIGAFVTLGALSEQWLSSLMLRLTDPLFETARADSGELLMFLASYGIEPSLLWIFLLVPLIVVPFALNQE